MHNWHSRWGKYGSCHWSSLHVWHKIPFKCQRNVYVYVHNDGISCISSFPRLSWCDEKRLNVAGNRIDEISIFFFPLSTSQSFSCDSHLSRFKRCEQKWCKTINTIYLNELKFHSIKRWLECLLQKFKSNTQATTFDVA